MIPNDIFRKIKIPRNVVKAIVFTIILGLFTHFFILTNKLINHDDLEQLVSKMDYSSSGRWFLQYANLPSSYFSMPWVNGILIIFYTSIISGIITNIFNIKTNLHIFLLSGILIMFPTNVALFHYTNSYDAYLFSAMLAFIGVKLFIKYKYGFLLSIFFATLSLATYQTFLPFFIIVLIIYYFKKYITTDMNSKEYIYKIIKVLLSYISAVILYIISVKYIFNIELSSYQNIDKMGSIDILSLPKMILNTYIRFYTFLIRDDYFQYDFIKYLNVFLLLGSLILIYKLIEAKEVDKKILSALTIFSLPIFVNLIFIMAPNSAIGLRMLQGYLGLYTFFIVLLEYFTINKKRYIDSAITSLSMWYVTIIIIVSLYQFFIVTNKVYTALEIDTTNVISYTTRVLSKIEDQDFYSSEKEVFFIGNPDIRTDFTEQYTTEQVLKSTILSKKLPAHYFWKLYPERYSAFPNHIENIWKVDYDKIDDENLIKMIDEMPIYPKKGSISEYDNRIYIKFKNYQ